jgi:hypothetical protein
MSADMIGSLVNAAIPLSLGIYFILLGRGASLPPDNLRGMSWAGWLGAVVLLGGFASLATSFR